MFDKSLIHIDSELYERIIDLEKGNLKILDDPRDPIFVLEKQVGSKKIEEVTKTILKELNNEIK